MVTVGVDPHKNSHTVAIVDQAGRRVGRALTVANDPSAVDKLIAWVGRHTAGGPVRFAIEDGRGLARQLATALVVAGYPVVWVPVRLMVEARRLLPTRGKSDPIDALAAAKAAQNPDNARYLAAHRADEIGRDVRHLVDERRDTVTDRTRKISTLRWRLTEYDRSLEPASLTSLAGPRRLAAALADRPASVLRDLLISGCEELIHLTTKINNLTGRITTLISDLCPTLLARRGVGPIVAATILGELGDPTRVRNCAAFARMAGTAPIPVWTSNTERHRLDRGGNRRLNAAIHTVALVQARHHPPAQALIAKHRPTKGTRAALRILKRHLTDILWRDLTTDLTHHTSQQTAA